ncbi:hypothetical protein T265_06777 [Opisthorchis viverrini]|uniref:Uncharacterized protein n=1 Tax=Opisthorchis viverrini TaxID=6198 RepID=A0A074ZEZ4_OPIVI|nr:hypothetical protein T265_06777 [Opisthorchis viverrini]KER25866.1 hypothetical protein T265_06777 [Opisthorchis viverrini]
MGNTEIGGLRESLPSPFLRDSDVAYSTDFMMKSHIDTLLDSNNIAIGSSTLYCGSHRECHKIELSSVNAYPEPIFYCSVIPIQMIVGKTLELQAISGEFGESNNANIIITSFCFQSVPEFLQVLNTGKSAW